jgi:N utilization substance protein B
MNNKDNRRLSRECAMQFLYEALVQKEYGLEKRSSFLSRLEQLRDYEKEEEAVETPCSIEIDYFNKVIDNVLINMDEINGLLEKSADNWRIDRISKVDLAILRLATAEIMFMNDIPISVSINEAVELAKKFGSEQSGRFINGILGKIVREKHPNES